MIQGPLFIAAFILGLAFTVALGPHRRVHLCSAVAFPVGVTIWVVALFVTYGVFIEVPPIAVALLYALLLCSSLALAWRRRRLSAQLWPAAVWLLGVSAVAFLVASVNPSRMSPDSMSFLIGGEILGTSGLNGLAWSKLAHRSVFHPVALSLADHVGLDYLYSYHIALSTSFAVAFAVILATALDRRGVRNDYRWLIVLLTTATLMTTYIVLWHSSYVHANLSTGFYLWMFVSMYWLAEVERNPSLAVVAAVALVALGLQRLETGVVAAIFTTLLLSESELSKRDLRNTLGTAIAVIAVWLVVIVLHGRSRFVSPGKSAATIVLLVTPFALHQAGLLTAWLRRGPKLALLAAAVVTTAAFVSAPDHMAKATANLAENLFVVPHMWGVTPLVLIALGALAARSAKVPFDRAMAFGIPIFVLFVIAIVRLRGPYRVAWGDSGNRMMLHIVPLCFFFYCLRLGPLLRLRTPFSRRRRTTCARDGSHQ